MAKLWGGSGDVRPTRPAPFAIGALPLIHLIPHGVSRQVTNVTLLACLGVQALAEDFDLALAGAVRAVGAVFPVLDDVNQAAGEPGNQVAGVAGVLHHDEIARGPQAPRWRACTPDPFGARPAQSCLAGRLATASAASGRRRGVE